MFNADGAWKGLVTVPAGLQVTSVADRSVLGIVVDDLGVERVRRYALMPPGEVAPLEQNSDSGEVIGADIWNLAASSIRHISLDSFPDIPLLIRQRASTQQCAVPQPSAVDPPQNVVAGEFAAPGQTDWAVLCTDGDSSGIFIEWGGPVQCSTPLAWSANRNFLQVSGPDEIEYSRAIGVASPEFILERAREYDGPAPPSTDHGGVNDAFVGKASTVHYCHEGRWFRLTGSD